MAGAAEFAAVFLAGHQVGAGYQVGGKNNWR